MVTENKQTADIFIGLLEVLRRLRAPGGCPWEPTCESRCSTTPAPTSSPVSCDSGQLTVSTTLAGKGDRSNRPSLHELDAPQSVPGDAQHDQGVANALQHLGLAFQAFEVMHRNLGYLEAEEGGAEDQVVVAPDIDLGQALTDVLEQRPVPAPEDLGAA